LTAPKFPVDGSSADIDRRVKEIVRDGLSVYRIEEEALKALAPDVIVTQDQCEVCAVSLSDVEAATCTWAGQPVSIVSLKPDSLADVRADIWKVASSLDAKEAGEELLRQIDARLSRAREQTADRARPRVAFIEWVDPLMVGGNWMPELIEAAGGDNLFGIAGKPSGYMQWEEVVAANPDVIIVGPCGYGLQRTLEELPMLVARPGWQELRAVRNGRVYFTDGNSYFNRPGPRLADSAEILVEILHPDVASPRHEGSAWLKLQDV
jgi:iron complex transport system substrate-binding protein